MAIIDKNMVLVGAGCIVREGKGNKKEWLIVKPNEDDDWTLPKAVSRKGESTARAAMRIASDKGAMNTKVLEEAGRAGGATTMSGKTVPQRTLYYLMLLKNAGKEPLGFHEIKWLKYAKAVRKLPSKRERAMLKAARKEYRKWLKEQKKKEEEKKKKGKK